MAFAEGLGRRATCQTGQVVFFMHVRGEVYFVDSLSGIPPMKIRIQESISNEMPTGRKKFITRDGWPNHSIFSILLSLMMLTVIACTEAPDSNAPTISQNTERPQSEDITTLSKEFPVKIVDDLGEIITIS